MDSKKTYTNKETRNRSITYDYEILERWVAGIELIGSEVKSVRGGNCSINESHGAFDERGQLFLYNTYVAPYDKDHVRIAPDTRRPRKLLLRRSELSKIQKEVKTPGLTVVPIRWFPDGKFIKCEIGLCRGKHEWDKREDIKKRDLDREMRREVR